MSELVNVQDLDGIMVITVNRPAARNAITIDCAHAMSEAFEALDRRDDVRIGILTGAGNTFSSGMDLKDFARTGKRSLVPGKGFAGLNEAPPKKPLIAAVEGYALAGGFEMMLACDLVVAANNAMFGLPEVKRGLVAGSGGMLRLPRHIPYRIAMEIVLTGDMLSAERAHHFGLINVMTEPGGALQGAIDLARRICENGPMAVQVAKQVVSKSLDFDQETMFDQQRPIIAPVFASDDAREGSLAFAEKRKPLWKGK